MSKNCIVSKMFVIFPFKRVRISEPIARLHSHHVLSVCHRRLWKLRFWVNWLHLDIRLKYWQTNRGARLGLGAGGLIVLEDGVGFQVEEIRGCHWLQNLTLLICSNTTAARFLACWWAWARSLPQEVFPRPPSEVDTRPGWWTVPEHGMLVFTLMKGSRLISLSSVKAASHWTIISK